MVRGSVARSSGAALGRRRVRRRYRLQETVDRAAGAVECGWVAGGDVLGVCEEQVGVELEGDLGGVVVGVEGVFGLGLGDGGLELVEPGSGER